MLSVALPRLVPTRSTEEVAMDLQQALAMGRRLVREHGLDGWTVVADQDGGSLTVVRGGEVVSRVALPAPACVVPA